MNIVPILIDAYYSGNVLNNPHLRRHDVRDVRRARGDDGALYPARSAGPHGGRSEADPSHRALRGHLAAHRFGYFFIPLIATFIFSLKSNQTGHCCTAANYSWVVHNSEFWHTLEDLVLARAGDDRDQPRALRADDRLGAPQSAAGYGPVIAFLTLIPFVIPPIVMVVGLLKFFKGTPSWFYVTAVGIARRCYVVLAMPFTYRAIDTGVRAIDLHTLVDASRNLGASWPSTLVRVVLPNVQTAALGAMFLTIALCLGEVVIATLLLYNTFPVEMVVLYHRARVGVSVALSMFTLVFTFLVLFGLSFVAQRRRGWRRGSSRLMIELRERPTLLR